MILVIKLYFLNIARNPDGTLELFKNKPSRYTLETTNKTKGSKRYGKVTI